MFAITHFEGWNMDMVSTPTRLFVKGLGLCVMKMMA